MMLVCPVESTLRTLILPAITFAAVMREETVTLVGVLRFTAAGLAAGSPTCANMSTAPGAISKAESTIAGQKPRPRFSQRFLRRAVAAEQRPDSISTPVLGSGTAEDG